MKITHLGHASLLVETGRLRILSDPWWKGPCFGAQWWVCPKPVLDPLEDRRLDYIYISHLHEDHFHPSTLRTLDRTAKVLIQHCPRLAEAVRRLGFEVLEVAPDRDFALGHGVSCRIVPTYGGDSFLILSDGAETLVNLNDAVHPLPRSLRSKFTRLIRRLHPRIDYVFCGYGVASHFPNCYIVPGKDDAATARKRQLFFNHAWAEIVHELAPRFGFPFAADVALLEDELFWANEVVHNCERPTAVFRRLYPTATTEVLDIVGGFVVENGEVRVPRLKKPLVPAEVRDQFREEIRRANQVPRVDGADLALVRDLLERAIARKAGYLGRYRHDYAVLLRFRNGEHGLAIRKHGSRLAVEPVADADQARERFDLCFTTRLAYLRRSLSEPLGNETLFVGSGGIFRYANVEMLNHHLHEEVMEIVSPFKPAGSRWRQDLKRLAKRLIDRDDFDLYNAARWTVFKTAPIEVRPANAG
ncbi:MBL fold metallo-hydrolase [Candidatus Methylocalor cossyra]|uniref:Beta-lactamase family protein n=1 Tax=Candidatus Methylocalor cossyra TaxID=3108543 RepID=A0ABM9NIJ0_9GAMM